MEIISYAFTVVAFAVMGFYSKIGLKISASAISVVLLVLALAVSLFIGVDTKIISLMKFSILLSNVLQGFILGILASVLLKLYRNKIA